MGSQWLQRTLSRRVWESDWQGKNIQKEQKKGRKPVRCHLFVASLDKLWPLKMHFQIPCWNCLQRFPKIFEDLNENVWSWGKPLRIFTSNPQRSSTILQKPLKFSPTFFKVFAGLCKDLAGFCLDLEESWRTFRRSCTVSCTALEGSCCSELIRCIGFAKNPGRFFKFLQNLARIV